MTHAQTQQILISLHHEMTRLMVERNNIEVTGNAAQLQLAEAELACIRSDISALGSGTDEGLDG